MANTNGARRAIEWFIGSGDIEPSDADLMDLHCFLRNLVDRIDAGTELDLPEWEIHASKGESSRLRHLN